MFYQLTKSFGKPICVALYGVFGFMAAKKKPLPLLLLVLLHTAEYFIKARPLAREKGLGEGEALAQCLAFGFTWWLPLQEE